VAVLGQQTIGYITVYVRPRTEFFRINIVGAISGLIAQSDHRRSGIGTRLLVKTQAFFQEHEIRYFSVYKAVANDSAFRFYEANGMDPRYTTFIGELDAPQN